MKRLVALALFFVFVMSMCSTVYAEPEQVGYGLLEEAMSGAVVRVTVDLAEKLSVGFYPMAFYLHDQPVFSDDADSIAYGTLLSEESYASLLEAHVDSERTDKDGYIVFKDTVGDTSFVAPVSEGLYILLIVDSSVADTDAVWARITYELQDFNFADPVQTASGVIADSMDESLLVDVTLDLSYGWSAKFLPCAFYLFNEDTAEGDFDVYGTLLSETDYTLIMESHADDETLVEEDGIISYTADGYKGIIAPVTENEYITLIVYGYYDLEAMWERVSYELF